jgi:biopolymer transport protein ExbD
MASMASEDGDIGFQIAPMVDVVFVLMLFFMASAGVQVVEKELSMNLPSGVGAPSDVPTTPIIVDITADGRVAVEGNSTAVASKDDKTLQPIRDFFKKTIDKFGDKDPVIVRPAPETRHERIMDVLNAAAASKVSKLTFSG